MSNNEEGHSQCQLIHRKYFFLGFTIQNKIALNFCCKYSFQKYSFSTNFSSENLRQSCSTDLIFWRYTLHRNPSFMIILWPQLFVQQKATLLWKSMLAFWSSLARILFHKIKLIISHTNQIMIHSVIISILKPKISVYYYGVSFFQKFTIQK